MWIVRSALRRPYTFTVADIVGQILNFGLPTPIDIQMTGGDRKNYALA
jgi:hypothetical protein